MNASITLELQFFLTSILWGAVLIIVYDFLRILRRLIGHGIFLISFEDLVYWLAASLFIFTILYKENNGIIRGFFILGMGIGMMLYYYVLSDLFVKGASEIIKYIMRPIMKLLRKLIKRLKNYYKSVNIKLISKVQAIKQSREESKRKKKNQKKEESKIKEKKSKRIKKKKKK